MVNLISLFVAVFALAAPVRVQLLATANGKFRLEACDANQKCDTLGNPEGYSRAQIEFWLNNFEPSSDITAKNVSLMVGTAGAVGLVTATVLGAPIVAPLSLAVLTFASFGWGFSQHPQIKSGMENVVFSEFKANPDLLYSLKKRLREFDAGVISGEANSSVINHIVEAKTSAPASSSTSSLPESDTIPAR